MTTRKFSLRVKFNSHASVACYLKKERHDKNKIKVGNFISKWKLNFNDMKKMAKSDRILARNEKSITVFLQKHYSRDSSIMSMSHGLV